MVALAIALLVTHGPAAKLVGSFHVPDEISCLQYDRSGRYLGINFSRWRTQSFVWDSRSKQLAKLPPGQAIFGSRNLAIITLPDNRGLAIYDLRRRRVIHRLAINDIAESASADGNYAAFGRPEIGTEGAAQMTVIDLQAGKKTELTNWLQPIKSKLVLGEKIVQVSALAWNDENRILTKVRIDKETNFKSGGGMVSTKCLFGLLEPSTQRFNSIYSAVDYSDLAIVADGGYLLLPELGGTSIEWIKNGKAKSFSDPQLITGHESPTGISISNRSALLFGVPLSEAETAKVFHAKFYLLDFASGRKKLILSGKHIPPPGFDGPALSAALSPDGHSLAACGLSSMQTVHLYAIEK